MISKLEMPRIAKGMIDRNRLLAKMNRYKDKKLTCITAPAGYGKTVFVRQFVESTALQCVWYQLDTFDNEPALFFQYLIAGLANEIPELMTEQIELDTDNNKNDERFLTLFSSIIQELNTKLKKELIVVFDDFHLISDPEILRFMEYFLNYLPTKIHIIISCRYLPNLQLLRLNAAGNVIEILQHDLEFNQSETQELLIAVTQNSTDKSLLTKADKLMGGWALGLSVLKLSLERSHDALTDVALYKGQNEIFQYIFSEVFESLPQEIREFLVKTSVLNVLTPEACNYMTNTENSSANLIYLEKRNLFIAVNGWNENITYRYHHVFKDFLLTLLGDGMSEIYSKAGEYYEQNSFFEQSVECFISAGKFDLALRVVEKAAIPLLMEHKHKCVSQWLEYAEKYEKLNTPKLIFAKGALLSYSGNFDVAEIWIDHSITLFQQNNDDVWLFKAIIHKARILRYRASFAESLILLENLSLENELLSFEDKIEAVIEKIYSLWLSGNIKKAIEYAEEILVYAKSLGTASAKKAIDCLSGYMTVLYYNQGEYTKALSYYQHTLEINANNHDALEKNSVNLFVAWIYRERGNPQKAIVLMQESIERKKRLGITEDLHLIYYNMSLAFNDLHDIKNAQLYISEAKNCFKQAGGHLDEYEGMLDVIQKIVLTDNISEPKQCEQFIDDCADSLRKNADSLFVYSSFHFAIAYLRLHRYDKAKEYISQPLVMCKNMSLKQFVAVLSGIMTVILLHEGDYAQAVEYAYVNISLSSKEQYIQTYLTYPELQSNLQLALENNLEPEFTAMLVKRIGAEAAPILISLIYNPNNTVRLTALKLLEEIGDSSVYHKLEMLFFEDDENIRLHAFEALTYLKEKNSDTNYECSTKLFIRCFGAFSVFTHSDWVTPIKWRTAKAKELFAYLIHFKGRFVLTERILADLWSDFDVEKARNLFHTNLTYVKKTLAGFGLEEKLQKNQTGYAIQTSDISCDAWIFDEVSPEYKKQMYSEDYLEDIYSDWAIEKREELELKYCEKQ